MPEYQVDQMYGDRVLTSKMTIATTPMMAAVQTTAAGGLVGAVGADKNVRWIRVQQAGRPHFEFGWTYG